MSEPSLARRPLPIGVFPLPFGHLLLPEHASTAGVRAGLLRGVLPAHWPPLLRGHKLALEGDLDGALEAFAGADVVSCFNRFVIDPDYAAPDAVDPAWLRAELGELGVLVDLVEFTVGRIDTVPDASEPAGEVVALLLAARAALAAANGHLGVAGQLLDTAILGVPPDYPVLAGVLYGAVGHIHRQLGAFDATVSALERGIALLAGTDLCVALAELHLELASVYHEQADVRADLLGKAVQHYHNAIQAITEEQAPALFAAAHANLATAYLTMPMVEASDQLRLGVAVGSLRAALRFYNPEDHPHHWSSAQLNLANALVYAPSTHQGDNLVEAVELYEAVLAKRSRRTDPLGYARVLANQGNVLAHLGLFHQARIKLVEARVLFEEFHEYDAVASVRGVLDDIARQHARVRAEPRVASADIGSGA